MLHRPGTCHTSMAVACRNRPTTGPNRGGLGPRAEQRGLYLFVEKGGAVTAGRVRP
jgi:hypothetical protein